MLTVTRGAAFSIDGEFAYRHVEVCDDLKESRTFIYQNQENTSLGFYRTRTSNPDLIRHFIYQARESAQRQSYTL